MANVDDGARREEPFCHGRRVVLKPLDADCLLDGQLHPMICQRLERVRELPLLRVANLIAVERDEQGIGQLVWEYVSGTPLEEMDCDRGQWLRVMREVLLSIESLHSAGIVHGAIHARNMIVEPSGAIRLTHISPLLYSEPEQDAADAIEMFLGLGFGDPDSPGADAIEMTLEQAREESWPLSTLYARLGELDGSQSKVEREQAEPAPTIRLRSLIAAGVVAIAGVLLALMILWMFNDSPLRS
jgi:hypothetical protein